MAMRQPQDPLRKDPKLQKKRQAWWPLYGLAMGLSAAGISYVVTPMLAPPLYQSLRPQMPTDQWNLLVAIVLFMLVVMFIGTLYAFLAPKPRTAVRISDRELDRARKARVAEEFARKEREKLARQQISRARNKKDK